VAQAKYTLYLPTHDEQGNVLKNLSEHVLHYLRTTLPRSVIHIEPPRPVTQGGEPSFHRAVVIMADDHPISDSHIKQVGQHVAEVANVATIIGVKEGKQGVKTWELSNPHHVPGAPSEALAQSSPRVPGQDPQQPSQPWMPS
jgi:hypothetical protein